MNTYIKQYMNYGDHNFIEITLKAKLRFALVASSQSSLSCQVVSSRAKWNLGFTGSRYTTKKAPCTIEVLDRAVAACGRAEVHGIFI